MYKKNGVKQILGLYIGTESIGWSLIRKATNPKIMDMGTRIFSSFVHNLGEGDRETSSATFRSLTRNARKIHSRKVCRKKRLLFFLADNKLCPLSPKELIRWQKKNRQRSLVARMNQWYALDPYYLRNLGLEKKLSQHELGRVLYHFTQRRGKIMNAAHNEGNPKILLQGLPAVNRLGITQTQDKLKGKYLGEYLYSILPEKGHPYHYTNERVRNRYLSRRMSVDEVKALLTKQKSYHNFITDSFIDTLIGGASTKGLIYFQRPAQYKKNGHIRTECPFEQTKRRLLKSHPLHEWYVLYCWVDSIRLYGEKLNTKQRETVLKVALQFSSFMFKKVRVALKVEDTLAFNYEDSNRVFLAHTLVQLSRVSSFGNKFLSLSEREQHELWHDLHFYTDKKMLEKRLRKRWGLSGKKAETVSAIKLRKGYGTLSMKATRIILSYLKKGFDVPNAIALAGIRNAVGCQKWKALADDVKKHITYFISNLVDEEVYSNLDAWIDDFRMEFDIELNTKKLYNTTFQGKEGTLLHSTPSEDQELQRKFKPVAQKPLFELRKLINNLIQEYGSIDQINFVLDGTVKASSKQRKQMYLSKKLRTQELPKIHDAVLDAGQNPTHTNLFKYKLWLEWNKTCPYTNAPISLEKLFSDEVCIVYIHPWKRFFNDSDRNKTLCMRHFAPYIKDKTPYEYFSTQPSGVWERVKTRVFAQLTHGSAKHVYYQNFKHFAMANYTKDAISQEFNDQHQMAIKLKRYLKRISPEVVAARGNAISSLRRKWGIGAVFSDVNKQRYLSAKEPAINALVTAINESKFLEELKDWNRYEPTIRNVFFPMPWSHFKQDALSAITTTSVSYAVNNKAVRKMLIKNAGKHTLSPKGKLHKDSFYGLRKTAQGEESFHIKKKINTLATAKQVSKIVDDGVRELVYDQIDLCGGFINGKVPKNALSTPTDKGWETNVFLPNKRGDKVPVRSVRMRENVSNAVQLQEGVNKYVNPRNNHHVVVYKTIDNAYNEHIVSFWEVVRRIRNKEPMYQLPSDGRMIIATMHIDDCFILGLSEKQIYTSLNEGLNLWDNVYRVQRLSSKYYEFRHIHDLDVYSQVYPSYVRILNFGDKKTGWLTHRPFKISISVLGKITPFYKPLKVPEMH